MNVSRRNARARGTRTLETRPPDIPGQLIFELAFLLVSLYFFLPFTRTVVAEGTTLGQRAVVRTDNELASR